MSLFDSILTGGQPEVTLKKTPIRLSPVAPEPIKAPEVAPVATGGFFGSLKPTEDIFSRGFLNDSVSFPATPPEKPFNQLSRTEQYQKFQTDLGANVSKVLTPIYDFTVKPLAEGLDNAMRLARASSYLVFSPVTYGLSRGTLIKGKPLTWDQIWEQSKTEAGRVLPKDLGGTEEISIAFDTLATNYLKERKKIGDPGKTNWLEAAKDVGYLAQLKFADIFGDPVFSSAELLKAAKNVKNFALYKKAGRTFAEGKVVGGKAVIKPIILGDVVDESGNIIKGQKPSVISSAAFEVKPTGLLKLRISPTTDGKIFVEGFKLRDPFAKILANSENLGTVVKDLAVKTGEYSVEVLGKVPKTAPGFARVPGFQEGGLFAKSMPKVPRETPITDGPLIEEARKYKTAEEFVSETGFVDDLGDNVKTNRTVPPSEISEIGTYEPKINYKSGKVSFSEEVPLAEKGYVYHSTFSSNLESIKKEGIVPNKSNNWEEWSEKGYSYFASSPKKALRWAKDLFEEQIRDYGDVKNFDDIVIVKVPVKTKSQLTDIWNKAQRPAKLAMEEVKFDRTKGEIMVAQKKIFGRYIPTEAIVDPSLFNNPAAIGEAQRSGIKLLEENGSLSEAVANHEGWHWLKRNLGADDKARLNALEKEFFDANPEKVAELRKSYKGLSDKALAEELAADEFANFYRTGKTVFEKFRIFFEKMLERLKALFSKRSEILKEFGKVKKTLKKTKGEVAPSESAFKLTPDEYALAKRKKQEILRNAVAGEPGALAMAQIFEEQAKLETVNPDVVEGIKNSTFYRKEKGIKDAMGEGYLMEKQGKFSVVEKKDVERYFKLGYSTRAEIDSLAKEAGFERGEDYLQAQLDASMARKTTDVRKITEEIMAKDQTFADLTSQIKEVEDELAGETVPAKRLLLEQGKRDLEKQIFSNRKFKIKAVQSYFGLTDNQMKKINYRDLRTMGVAEFEAYLNEVQGAAFKESERDQAKNELVDLIRRRDLKRIDNLQRAMELPPIDKMTTEQLREFADALEPYQVGDEFLSTRKLETIDKTSFAGAKTWREALEKVRAKTGLAPGQTPQTDWLDKLRFDTALAEKDPFYNYLVKTVLTSRLKAMSNVSDLQKKVDKLFGEARDFQVIPTDPKIAEYLESDNKLEVAETMTPEQLKAATFVNQYYVDAYKYLVDQNALQKSAYEGVYMPHIQRGFFEAIKESGFKDAFKELLQSQKVEQQMQTILDEKTGKIMPYEKWLKFAQHREGGVVPTKNVAKSLMIYAKALENKKALDSVVPEILTATDVLTPREETPEGVKVNETLKTFVNTYLNTRKGRPEKLIVPPGSKTDFVLKALRSFTIFRDLGLNIPLQLGSIGGVHSALLTLMKPGDYAKGVKRLATKEGRKIVSQYENYTGRTPWSQLTDRTKDLPDKLYGLMFALFQSNTVRGNKIHLLGSMTDAEYAAGKVTPERLAELKLEAGRWLPVEGSSSIIGASTEGKLATQYLTWAIPIARTNLANISKFVTSIKEGNWENLSSSREFQESFRMVLIGGIVSLLALATADQIKKNPNSFVNKLISKTLKDAMSLFSALNPLTFGQPRVISFVLSLEKALEQLITLQKYTTSGEGYKKGDLKGVAALKKTLLPNYLQPNKSAPSGKPKESTGGKKIDLLGSTGNKRKKIDLFGNTKPKKKINLLE